MGNSNQEIILNCARWSTNWRIKLNKIISPVTELVLYCYMHMMLWGGCAKELNHRIERRRRSSSPLLFSVYWFLSMVLYDRNSQYWGKYLCFRLSFFPRFFLSHATIEKAAMNVNKNENECHECNCRMQRYFRCQWISMNLGIEGKTSKPE